MEKNNKETEGVEAWYQTWCPYCRSTNWFHDHEEAEYDVEAVHCWNCGKNFWLPGCGEAAGVSAWLGLNELQVEIVDGLEYPG